MKVLGRIFLNSRKERRKDVKTERRKDVKTERRKDGVFFVRCRRTYVLNNTLKDILLLHIFFRLQVNESAVYTCSPDLADSASVR